MSTLQPNDLSRHTSAVPTLAELIIDRKGDRSYTDLATLTDFVVTRQRFQQLATNVRMKEFPEPSTLTAISVALGVDVALVVLATAKSVGMDIDRGADSDLALMLPAATRNLTTQQRNAVLAVVRSIVLPDDAQPGDRIFEADAIFGAAADDGGANDAVDGT